MDFRDPAWVRPDVAGYFAGGGELARASGVTVAAVDADPPSFSFGRPIGAVHYFRRHGPAGTVGFGSYSDDQLRRVAAAIDAHVPTLVYFNNDLDGMAVANARRLIEICRERGLTA